MALFKLTETRYLDTGDIADIQYTPSGFSPNLTPGIDEGLVQTRSLLESRTAPRIVPLTAWAARRETEYRAQELGKDTARE